MIYLQCPKSDWLTIKNGYSSYVENIGTQGVHDLFFGELKASGSSSIVIRLIHLIWLRYTAKTKEFVSP